MCFAENKHSKLCDMAIAESQRLKLELANIVKLCPLSIAYAGRSVAICIQGKCRSLVLSHLGSFET